MVKVLLDTNFLLIPYSLGVDIFSEIDRIIDTAYEFCIIDKTVDELNNIIDSATTQSGKDRDAARFALKLLEKKDIKLIKTESIKNKTETIKNVDELILENTDPKEFIVATQDQDLKRKLKLKGIPLIVLRQKKHLKLIRV